MWCVVEPSKTPASTRDSAPHIFSAMCALCVVAARANSPELVPSTPRVGLADKLILAVPLALVIPQPCSQSAWELVVADVQ